MNQEELKQRLMRLIADIQYLGGLEEKVADHLIANGVTIRERGESDEDEVTIRNKNIKFNTGDYARIVGNECSHGFALGTIVQLEKHEIDYRATDVNGCYWWVIDDELEPADVADWEGVKDEFEERNA